MEKDVFSKAIAFMLFVSYLHVKAVSFSVVNGREAGGTKALQKDGICSWERSISNAVPWRILCSKDQFQCIDGKCIERSWHCDGTYDCGDHSDEAYCNTQWGCPTDPPFVRCRDTGKCIPKNFINDGHSDCPYDDDENEYGYNSTEKLWYATAATRRWINRQMKSQSSVGMWGTEANYLAVVMYFADANFTSTNEGTRRNLAYEISIQLLSRLAMKRLHEIPSTDLASFVNAFLVTCLNPRKFHGIDLIQELRTRVNKQNYTNPYVLLSLCNAGDTITEMDKAKLLDTFWNKQRTFWTDMQAYVVMALACASKQSGNGAISEQLSELTLELKQHQYRNGSIENLQTTTLVMQALISTESERDPDNFDEKKAIKEIVRNQETDGSFGDLQLTYFAIPVFFCKSFVDINSDHCEFVKADETTSLQNLENQGGAKIRVQYSLWIGNEKNLERNLALKVPANMSLYGVMELAADIDSRYRFEYVVKDRKPYINAISGFRDNPEKGKFWFLYKIEDGKPKITSQNSPANVLPKENDHYVMWYQSGSWTD